MRLNERQVQAIRDSVKKNFPSGTRVYLFGSRTDDNARGGDIDLLIETALQGVELQSARYKAMSDISMKIGDQKIDIVITSGREKEKSLILLEAEKEKILL